LSAADESPATLARGIRKWDLVALGVNFIIGAGIFGLPSRVYRLSGPASLIAFVVCAVVMCFFVLCFAEVASRFRDTGGPYLYAREAFGPLIGFEVGWLRWLSGVASFAANANLLVDYLSYFWPTAASDPARPVVIITLAVFLMTINVLGVRNAAMLSNGLGAAKLIALFVFVAVGIFFVHPQNLSIAARPSYRAVSTSVLLLVQTFIGFESVAIAAGEVREPERSVPFALFTAISSVTLLYLLVQLVCIGTLPELAYSARPLADAATLFIGSVGGSFIAGTAVLSIAGNLHGQLLATSRTIYAISEQRQLPQRLAAINRRFRTPHLSIISTAVVTLAFALSGTFTQLVTISVIARLAVYAATCGALPILRFRKATEPPFRLRFGNTTAVVSVALCLLLLSSSTRREALTTSLAAAVGLLVYWAHRMQRALVGHETS
jgi:amino acid transporter